MNAVCHSTSPNSQVTSDCSYRSVPTRLIQFKFCHFLFHDQFFNGIWSFDRFRLWRSASATNSQQSDAENLTQLNQHARPGICGKVQQVRSAARHTDNKPGEPARRPEVAMSTVCGAGICRVTMKRNEEITLLHWNSVSVFTVTKHTVRKDLPLFTVTQSRFTLQRHLLR